MASAVLADSGGPPVGNGRRRRNTVVNQSGKKTNPLAPNLPRVGPGPAILSPSGLMSAYGGLQSAQYQFGSQLAADRAKKSSIFAQQEIGRTQARMTAGQNMTSTIQDALQRNILGSSADYMARAGVRANLAQTLIQNKQQALASLAGLQMDKMDQQFQLTMAQQQFQMQMAAMQAAAQAAAIGQEPTMTPQMWKRMIARMQNNPAGYMTTPTGAEVVMPGAVPSGAYTNPGSYSGA